MMYVTVHYEFLVSVGPVDVPFGCSWYYFLGLLLHKDKSLCSAIYDFWVSLQMIMTQGCLCSAWYDFLALLYYARALCSALHNYLVSLLHKGVSFFSAFHYFLVSLLHQQTYFVAVDCTVILFHRTWGLVCVLYVSWCCSVSITPVDSSLLLSTMTF